VNAEQQQSLVDCYPDLLEIEPCPWGPGMGFTFRVGAAGWFDLLDKFCQAVTSINRSQGSAAIACKVKYIKEKMGELRIACEGANEQIWVLINEVRLESARTCQVCGRYGTLYILPGSVAATLCEDDAKQLSRDLGRVSARELLLPYFCLTAFREYSSFKDD
jgi:hypothetical protein